MPLQKRISRLFTQLTIGILLAIDAVSCVTLSATCNVEINPNIDSSLKENKVTGTVTFTQVLGDDTSIAISLSGFVPTDSETLHGFHVHASSNMTLGCNSLGGHYNPKNRNHGAPTDTVRHYGDLGNIKVTSSGTVESTITDSLVTLSGDYSVIGRSIVVHEKDDDLGKVGDSGSLATGNAGKRLACCIITTSAGSKPSPVLYSVLLAAILSLVVRLA